MMLRHCKTCLKVEVGMVLVSGGYQCRQCLADEIEKQIVEFNGGSTWGTVDITCPHCGHEHVDSWDIEDGEHDCENCERPYYVDRDVSVTYNTVKT